MKTNENDPIFEALGELPRETASDEFTRRLLLRVAEDADERRSTLRGGRPRLAWATAGALALVTVVAAGLYERQRERRELRGELSTIQRERLELLREFDALRSARGELPVAYLGGDERNDYVLTLNQTTRR